MSVAVKIEVQKPHLYIKCRDPECEHLVDLSREIQYRTENPDQNYAKTTDYIRQVCRAHPGKLVVEWSEQDGVIHADATWVELEPGEGYVPCLSVLKTDNGENDDPIYLIIKEDYYNGRKTIEENFESRSYWYNQHTCISNWLGVEQVISREHIDPHGAFQLYKLIPDDVFRAANGVGIEEYLSASTNENEHKWLVSVLPELFRDHAYPKK